MFLLWITSVQLVSVIESHGEATADMRWFFRTVDVKDGLADNFVRDITTDSEGYIWFSTINGLSRYDGYRFLNFQPQQWGGRSGDVSMVRETADGTFWMLCSGELLTYHRATQTWLKDGTNQLRQIGIQGSVQHFYVDENGDLWVITEGGLWYHDYHSQRLSHIECQGLGQVLHIVTKNGTTLVITAEYNIYKVSSDKSRLSLLTHHPKPEIDDRDSRVMMDSQMNLWIYHAHIQVSSLWVYSLNSDQWLQPSVLQGFDRKMTINAIAEDHDGRLWIGTGNHGIRVIDWCENQGNKLLEPGLARNQGTGPVIHITCLFADQNNTMWVGSAKFGASYADLNSPEFIHETTDGHEDVSALMEDSKGNIWIGFDGEGIMMRGKTGSTSIFSVQKGQLPSDNITTLITDNKGNILVGTYGGGIAQFNGNQFIPLYPGYDRLRYVKAITADRHGSLWIATVDQGVVCITADGRISNYTAARSPLRSDGILCLTYDSQNDIIYIGTSIGLAAYDCTKGDFISNNALDSLKDVSVTSLLIDNNERLWIGSRNGIWVLNSGKAPIIHLTTEQGMTNNVVRALTMNTGTIWVSTDNGITNITAVGEEYKCRPYFDSDGLHGIVFSNNAALTTHDGNVFLGCLTGYVSIPSESKDRRVNNPPSIKVSFTEFRINGNPIVKSQQDFTIDYGERLGVSISTMMPALTHKIRYYYRFKDEDEWMRAPSNMLYFASLMPGTHVLQVKAELPGIATTEVSELAIRVSPPFWLSNPAIICYLLLFTVVGWLIWHAIRRRQERELAMKQMELNLRKYEMEEQKISFFTNISHDIKTPLTMVMAPLEKIREVSLPTTVRTEIDVAWQNARQLYDLVLELLDFRRLDVGKEKLNLSHGELVSFVRQTVQGFDYYATRKQICIQLQLPETPIETLFDENKMRRIITNLLSNAVKYNIEGGSVIVTLSYGNIILLSVADTGIGIKDKNHVFDRFVQETHGQEQEGSGLGLHIVHQYVEMMGGSITVTDNQPQGTVITVTLPLNHKDKSSEDADPMTQELVPETRHPTLLVVEDNTDARLFLQRSLENEYHILLASNGKEALSQLGIADGVSMIISDVMMPVMNGMELVRHIRKDIRFSHIPIILLTAKSSEEDIVSGLEEGVADYLTKPYSLAVLRLRIKKILEWTQHIHEQVATGIEIKPSEITVSSIDEEFISHVIAEVEANINDSSYSVVQLSSAVGMTRGTLYKKLMAIVGKSPIEFIRIIRLKRGKSLLDQGRTNISEVADNVGISPKMFAQYFRDTYGESPSDYLKKRKLLN